jgi:hypothetical protein
MPSLPTRAVIGSNWGHHRPLALVNVSKVAYVVVVSGACTMITCVVLAGSVCSRSASTLEIGALIFGGAVRDPGGGD